MRVIDLSTLSMVDGSGIAETKIPLWWADGTSSADNSVTAWLYLVDGSTSFTLSPPNISGVLHTLSSNWSQTQKYALEVTMWVGSSGATLTAGIFQNPTSNGGTMIGSVSTGATSATVLRSSQFTLTPSSPLGVAVQINNSGVELYISDASLIVFPQ